MIGKRKIRVVWLGCGAAMAAALDTEFEACMSYGLVPDVCVVRLHQEASWADELATATDLGTPVLALVSDHEEMFHEAVLDAGATDILTEPASIPLLRRRLKLLTQTLGVAGEQPFRAMIEDGVQGVLVYHDWQPIFANAAYARMLGFAHVQELYAVTDIRTMLAPRERKRITQYSVALEAGMTAPTHYEVEAIHRRGQLVTLLCVASALPIRGSIATHIIAVDITSKKLHQALVEQARTRAETVIRHSPNMVVMESLDGRYLMTNPAFGQRFGIRPDDALGQKVADIAPADSVVRTRTLMAEVLADGQPREYDTQVETMDGAIHFRVVMFPILGSDGEITAIGRISTDMSEQKYAEEQMRVSDARLRAFFDNSPHGMSIQATDGKYLLNSPSYMPLYGYPNQAIRGKYPHQVWPQPIADNAMRVNARVCDDKTPMEYDEAIDIDGATKHVHTAKFPIIDDQGTVRGIGSIGSDITARVVAEQTLRHSRRRFQDFAESSSDWFWEMGDDLRFSMITEQRSGPLSSTIIEQLDNTRNNNALGPTQMHLYSVEWQEFWRHVWDHKPVRNIELPITDDTGERRYMRTSGVPIFNDDNHFSGYRGIATDVTQIVATQRKLRQLASEVSLAEERERRRIATELHDGAVQNLGLARIKLGSVLNSLSAQNTEARLTELRELLAQSVRELRALMSELSPPMLYELGLYAALEWLVGRYQHQHGVECYLQVQGDCTQLADDISILLFQSIRELLMNVVKYAQASQVLVSLTRVDQEIVVTVKDNGVGMAPAGLEAQPSDEGNFGLFNIRERLGHIRGSLTITAHEGTTVTLRAPVDEIHHQRNATLGS